MTRNLVVEKQVVGATVKWGVVLCKRSSVFTKIWNKYDCQRSEDRSNHRKGKNQMKNLKKKGGGGEWGEG